MAGKRETLFYQIGLEFFEYLEQNNQTCITNRHELSAIYNQKFKSRNPGTSYPSFGSVLHGLKVFDRIEKDGDNIFFKYPVTDQRSHRAHQQWNGAASHGTLQANTGVQDQTRPLAEEYLTENWAQVISDENGIRISSDHQFKDRKLCLYVDKNEERVVNLKVENTGTEPVCFYMLLNQLRCFTLKDEKKVTEKNPLCLYKGHSYEVQVLFCCRYVGFYPAKLAFEFKPDLQTSPAFRIVCIIEAECITALGRELGPIAPYKRRSPPAPTPKVKYRIVDGRPPEGLPDMQLRSEVALKEYKMPLSMNELIHLLKNPTFRPKASHTTLMSKALLKKELSWKNYFRKFHLLLFLEEKHLEDDMRKFNIPNDEREEATMTRDPLNKDLLILEVPGLSENRPSVLRGDWLLVYPVGEEEVKYRGYVHNVQRDSLQLGFSQKLLNRFEVHMKFKVEFSFSQLTLRLQHRAAELAVEHRLEKVLFPVAPAFSQQAELPRLSLFDSKLESNPEQYQAVQHIVAGSSKPAPYLVFGPPGTGKTVILVEAIKQIEKAKPSCHILACAPCNDATDLLFKMIVVHMDEHKVFRMYAKSCDPKSVPEDLKACTNLEGEHFHFPAKEKLMEYKIIVTTLFTAGRLVTGNIPEGHFSHVFVDEAGQAVETECVIPLAGLLHAETGQVVLAGDPKQLGPIIRSSLAAQYDLGMSLLERMMKLYQQKKDAFNKRFVTKLLRNYRSHPAILKIPNKLFYDGELQVHADENVRNSYCGWDELPQKGFPVIFHSVYGVETREAHSPSFFNVAEVEVLMDYLEKLMKTSGKGGLPSISPSEIGIITPYRKQVQKIRKALDKVGKDLKTDMNCLKVGTVEEFQGQERTVIMVSTVRSKFETDNQFNLGFVKNEKRFNVAVTRAKALLIVVGNPTLLMEDNAWKEFINHCLAEGGHVPKEENDALMMQLAALRIDNEAQENGV